MQTQTSLFIPQRFLFDLKQLFTVCILKCEIMVVVVVVVGGGGQVTGIRKEKKQGQI